MLWTDPSVGGGSASSLAPALALLHQHSAAFLRLSLQTAALTASWPCCLGKESREDQGLAYISNIALPSVLREKYLHV